jgi:serine/threonine protein kinase
MDIDPVVSMPSFQQLNRAQFVAQLQSAVGYLHSLGLAHNDINPDNIMVKNGLPILIDFGSCQVFGKHLQSLGTPGWCRETFLRQNRSMIPTQWTNYYPGSKIPSEKDGHPAGSSE